MLSNKKIFVSLLFVLCISCNFGFAQVEENNKRILFYEVGAPGTYTIESGYSVFADELKKQGYDVASLTKGSLTSKALENYDMLVVPDLRRKLGTEEISSIISFVLQDGKSLFISGDGSLNANQLTIPFGVTIDDGILVDTTNMIGKNRNVFLLNNFPEFAGMNVITQNINEITIDKGHGFILSVNARAIVRGDSDTYSETGSFPAGSMPPVSAANIFGNGLVFVHTDADFLTNTGIKQKDNKKFGLQIIDWLAITTRRTPIENSSQDLQVAISTLKIEKESLKQDVDRLTYETQEFDNQNTNLGLDLLSTNERLTILEAGMIGPLNRNNWSYMALGLSFISSVLIISKAKTPKPEKEDVLSELGYDLEEVGDDSMEDIDL